MTTPDPDQHPYGSYPTPSTGAYPPVPGYSDQSGYPATGAYPSGAVPTAGYPGLPDPNLPAHQPGGFPPGGYPPPGYPLQPGGYPAAYGPPFPGGYPVAPRNGMGTAALVLGIIGVVLCWNAFGIILGILAIIFGGVGMGRAKQGAATNRGSAMAGLILGIVALVVFVVVVIAIVGTVGYNMYG